jgi:hypothetical protein
MAVFYAFAYGQQFSLSLEKSITFREFCGKKLQFCNAILDDLFKAFQKYLHFKNKFSNKIGETKDYCHCKLKHGKKTANFNRNFIVFFAKMTYT